MFSLFVWSVGFSFRLLSLLETQSIDFKCMCFIQIKNYILNCIKIVVIKDYQRIGGCRWNVKEKSCNKEFNYQVNSVTNQTN